MRYALKSAVLMLLVGVPLASATAMAEPAGCIDVEVSLAPPVVCAGQTVTVNASITNCGTSRDGVHLAFVLLGPGMGYEAVATTKLGPEVTKAVSQAIPIPAGMPAGAYTVTVTATTRNGGSDSAVASVEVAACSTSRPAGGWVRVTPLP
jgi:uncharacterized membrane protein